MTILFTETKSNYPISSQDIVGNGILLLVGIMCEKQLQK